MTSKSSPKVTVVSSRAAIEVTGSSRIVHHAELTQLREVGVDPLQEERQVLHLVLVEPEDLEVGDGGEDGVGGDVIAVQH